MKSTISLLLLSSLMLSSMTVVHADQPKIKIRLSFKAIRMPGTGIVQDFAVKETMLNVVIAMNLAMERAKRGYEFIYDDFNASGQMIQIGDPNNNTTDPANPSYWWGVEPGQMSYFGVQANAHPTEFAFKSDHVNIYLPVVIYGAAGAQRPDEDGNSPAHNNFIVSGRGGALAPNTEDYAATMLHEFGHYFSLLHTFNTDVGTAVDGTTFGNDGMIDTLLDTAGSNSTYGGASRGLNDYADLLYGQYQYSALNATQQANALAQWRNFYAMRLFQTSLYSSLSAAQKARIDAGQAAFIPSNSTMHKDLIAAFNYQKVFDGTALPSLSANEQAKVVNLINNYMGYTDIPAADQTYTGMQLDTMGDVMTYGGRLAVVSGRTYFMGAGNYNDAGAPLGSSARAYTNPASLAAAPPSTPTTVNDQVLVRPGAYAGAITLNKPMTIRVSSMNNNATNALRTDQHATFGSTTNH